MKKYISTIVAAMVIIGFTAGCVKDLPEIPMINPKLTDEDQILRILDDVQKGIESRHIYQVMSHVARSYNDSEGRDYDSLASFVNKLFETYHTIRVTRVKPRIIVQGTQARAVETFGTLAKPFDIARARSLDVNGQVTIFFEKIDGQWQIVEWGSLR